MSGESFLKKALEALPNGPFLLRDLAGKIDTSMMWKLRGQGYVKTCGKRTLPHSSNGGTYRLQTYQITAKGRHLRGTP